MLSGARARQLARLAARRRSDGSRGVLAGRAWRLLTAAADRGEPDSIEAAWQTWLRAPDDEVWQALCRWRDRQVLAEAALAAAVDPDRAPGNRKAVGEFCVGHDLVPDEEIERALLFMMTGQTAQHRAADPDGTLLAAAYRAAQEPVRTALRAAMAESGELDLARVVSTHRAQRLTDAEVGYLTSQLAGREDWPALWRLCQDLPLPLAMLELPRLGAWRPADDRGRALFDLLARADRTAISAAGAALVLPWVFELEIDAMPTNGSFSPDGKMMLIATSRHGQYTGCRVLDLPGGTIRERHDYAGDSAPAGVLHLGEAFLVVGRRGRQHELVRYAAGRATVTDRHHERITVAPYPGGFVAGRWSTYQYQWLGAGGTDGEIARQLRVHTDAPSYLLAAERVSGRLALYRRDLADQRELLIFGYDATRLVARMPWNAGHDGPEVCFLGQDRIVIQGHGRTRLFRIADGRLKAAATRQQTPAALVPLNGMVAVLDGQTVRYLGADGLAEVYPPRTLAGGHVQALWGSADGRSHAFGGWRDGRGAIEVSWAGDLAIMELLGLSLGTMSYADLGTVKTALNGGAPEAARPFLELLKACLEIKLGSDVAISQAWRADGDDDIALSAATPEVRAESPQE